MRNISQPNYYKKFFIHFFHSVLYSKTLLTPKFKPKVTKLNFLTLCEGYYKFFSAKLLSRLTKRHNKNIINKTFF